MAQLGCAVSSCSRTAWRRSRCASSSAPAAEEAAPAAESGAGAGAGADADADAAGLLAGARWAARAACVGLLLTGVVPLQLPPGHALGDASTAVHSLGSLAYFVGSQWHAVSTLRALAAPGAAQALPLSLRAAPGLFAAKALAAASSVLSFLPAQLLHPGGTPLSPHPGGAEAAQLDSAGFSQWWVVGSLLAYWALSGVDFVLLSAPAAEDADEEDEALRAKLK